MNFFTFTKLVRVLLLSAVVVVIGAVGVSYGDDNWPSELLGHWVYVRSTTCGRAVPERMELFKDGKGVIEVMKTGWNYGGERFITWEAMHGRLVLDKKDAFTYKVKGYELFLPCPDDDDSSKYVKKEYLEAKKKRDEEESRREEERIKKERQEATLQGWKQLPTFIDSRDGQKYRTVKIGGKTWMAQNLNFQPKAGNSWCFADNSDACQATGRLYDWSTAKTVCPDGWRLPEENASRSDWGDLVTAAGGKGEAGKALKISGGYAWGEGKGDGGNGEDTYLFSALGGGFRTAKGEFDGYARVGGWWTAGESGTASDKAKVWAMSSRQDGANYGEWDKKMGYSVRCVQK